MLNELEEILMEEYFTYLEELRHSGITNMYGAVPYLQRAFPELAKDPWRAGEILKASMDSRRGGNDQC